jgi:hypothetical protein
MAFADRSGALWTSLSSWPTFAITMQPQTGLSSTGFALADADNECLILQPSEAPDPFTIAPRPGASAVEWHSLAGGETVSGPGLTVSDTKITISTQSEIAGPGRAASSPFLTDP